MTKAEKFFKEYGNTKVKEWLSSFFETTRYIYQEGCYFILENENILIKGYGQHYDDSNCYYDFIFNDKSAIEIDDLYGDYQDPYISAIYTDVDDEETRKKVHYIKHQDIVVYTD